MTATLTEVSPLVLAERVVIGVAMSGAPDTTGALLDLLGRDHPLSPPRHSYIWRAVAALHDRGEPTDPAAVGHHLDAAGALGKAGGLEYLHTCYAAGLGLDGPYHARQILDDRQRRALEQLSVQADNAAKTADREARIARVAELRELLDRIAGTPKAAGGHVDRIRAALITPDQLDSIPELEPLIGDMLYRNSTAWLIGPPANGKSFVALDMAGSVATGETWQGSPVEQGPVLYLVAEGLTGIKQRIRAWESGQNQKMTGLTILPVAVQAAEGAQWDAFVAVAAEMDPRPNLVVVDTQARVTVGMEENSARDMGQFVQRIEQLREATGACVLVVHHQGRSGEHMRGSTALEGAATTVIKVKKADDLLTVECVKQKDAPEFDKVTLRLISHGPAAILALTDPGQGGDPTALLESHWLKLWWESHESDEVSVSVLTKTEVVSEATFHRQKFALIRAGLVERTGAGRNVRYKLTRQP
ncbi:AAA family ATPase [Micromonospora sp. NPDC050686]|uniref:AAA family ATPase n=1 Tax=Micromonospora sp. NPDC050686 TaxID=3154631 RepID=UPI003405D566